MIYVRFLTELERKQASQYQNVGDVDMILCFSFMYNSIVLEVWYMLCLYQR